MWSLDITKTNASIPYAFRKEIKNLISAVKKRSLSKISHGNRIIKKSLNFDNSKNYGTINDKEFDRFRYIIDINNAYFKAFMKKIKESDLKLLLATIQENLPIAKIIENNDSDPSKHDRSDVKEKLTQSDIEIAKFVFKNKITEMSKSTAFSWLLQHEPFCYYEDQPQKRTIMNKTIEQLLNSCLNHCRSYAITTGIPNDDILSNNFIKDLIKLHYKNADDVKNNFSHQDLLNYLKESFKKVDPTVSIAESDELES